MKKQLLALASITLISSNVFAASVVVSSNGNPVGSNISPTVTAGTGPAEAFTSKTVATHKSLSRAPFKTASKYEPTKPAVKKPAKKKVVKKKAESKTGSSVTTTTTNTIGAPSSVVAPVVAAPVTTAPAVTQPVTTPVAPARIQ